MKKRINKLKLGWRNRTPIDENQLSVGLNAFFSAQVFLIPACGSEHQEQASWMEKEVIPPEVNFEIGNQSKNKEIQKFKSNDRMKFESSVQLTYRYKEVDWSPYKKLKIPSSLAIYQGDGLTLLPNYPFSSSRSSPIC